MTTTAESREQPAGCQLQIPASDPVARLWDRDAVAAEAERLVYRLPAAALGQIRDAMSFARANGLDVESMAQEDFRVPAFARDVAGLHRRLDTGRGFLVLGGIDVAEYSESEAEMIAWGLCNYLGQPIRQGLDRDRRLFTVSDRGAGNADPTRIGATPKRSAKHSDNGCLEPRPPCYLGLFCYASANKGGESTVISARTVYDTVARERPDFLPLYFQSYHFRAPQAHIWPSRGPTVQKPILELTAGELRIHYARVMIEPGMEMAGMPLTAEQRAALDYLDEVLERPELNFTHLLQPGELLVLNNLVLLHGREAFTPGAGGRTMKRLWMWRRHWGPGTDPVALDEEEFA